MLKNFEIPYRVATTHMKGIEIGEENTKLFHINPNKDVIRMAGRGNIGLLSLDLIKKKLITKNTFSRPLNPDAVKKAVSGHQCFASKIYISANLEVYPCVMERRISHVHPLRWKAERTFAWFNFSRRLSKDYEISPFYQEQICIISNLQTLLRRF